MTANQAQVAVGGVAAAVGIGGAVITRDLALTAAHGIAVADLVHLNPLSAWLTLLLGLVAVVGGASGRRGLGALAGAGFLLIALSVLMGTGGSGNPLGATAGTFGFTLGVGAGLLALGADWQ